MVTIVRLDDEDGVGDFEEPLEDETVTVTVVLIDVALFKNV